MAKRNVESTNRGIVGILPDVPSAGLAIDSLSKRGFVASPVSMDRAKSYRSSVGPDEVLVFVTCGDDCDAVESVLSEYGASGIGSSGGGRWAGRVGKTMEVRPILTAHDSERVIEFDGESEVKEGPYVEPDIADTGYQA